MKTLTKRDIVLDIYKSYPLCSNGAIQQTHVKDIVQMTLNILSKSLSNGRNVELRNFGVLELQVRKARVGRNPAKPGKDITIPRRVVVKFKPGKELKSNLVRLDISKIEEAKASKARKRSL